MTIKTFFDPVTSTLSYVVFDQQSRDAFVIDPVLDFDFASGAVSTQSVEKVHSFIIDNGLKVHWTLETHAHADHLTGSQVLKKKCGAPVGIGENIREVQSIFMKVFNMTGLHADGSPFDGLFKDGDQIKAGTMEVKVIATPGHTPACVSFLCQDALFVGDALFMPDSGTGRCDFPGGSADVLFRSITERIYRLPAETRVFVGHDYQPNGRGLLFESTVRDQMKDNIHLNVTTTKEEFVQFRTERDSTLRAPQLLLPSLQVNIRAGHLPRPDTNGMIYLKIPLTLKV